MADSNRQRGEGALLVPKRVDGVVGIGSVMLGLAGCAGQPGVAELRGRVLPAPDGLACSDYAACNHGLAAGPLLDASAEYYYPTHASRRIHSGFLNAAMGAEVIRPVRLSAMGGLTFTFADGNIVQWNDSFQDVRYPTAAAGIGPMFLLRVMLAKLDRVSLAGEMVGAIVLYSERFPPAETSTTSHGALALLQATN